MRKGYDFLGKTIVSYETGEKIDRVKDIVFDPNTNRLLALVVREGNWFSQARVVLFQDIRAIGTNAVIISSRAAIIPANQVAEVQQVLAQPNILRGTQILTTDGHDLGRMIDLYVDEETGMIEGYEVSGSSLAHTFSGHSFIPAPQTLKVGQQVAFVPPTVLDLMQERWHQPDAHLPDTHFPNAGSLDDEASDKTGLSTTAPSDMTIVDVTIAPETRKAFVIGKSAQWMVNTPDGTVLTMAGQEITPAMADLAEQQGVLHELYRATGGDGVDAVSEQTTALTTASTATIPTATPSTATDAAISNYTVEQTLGRRARQLVRSSEGAIVVATGQIVTERVIERAKRYHTEQALRAAVGLPTQEDIYTNQQFETTVNQVGEQLRRGAHRAEIEARSLWQQLKLATEDWKERNRQATEVQKIKAALGRPVLRVILDRQDNVILNVGELVTHEAIESARRSDVLDILLDSVDTQTPSLSSTNTRAPRTGKASLESHEYGESSY